MQSVCNTSYWQKSHTQNQENFQISKKKTDDPIKKLVEKLKQALSQKISEKSTNISKDAQFHWLKNKLNHYEIPLPPAIVTKIKMTW